MQCMPCTKISRFKYGIPVLNLLHVSGMFYDYYEKIGISFNIYLNYIEFVKIFSKKFFQNI